MSLNKKSVDDFSAKGKRVLVRCDFNVPLKNGEITDETRIVAALPTIKKLINDGGKVILCSHLGKVKEGPNEKESLAPVAKSLSEKLGKGQVRLASEMGFGIALRGGDKWTAEVNYLLSDWTSTGMDKVTGFANVGNAVFAASKAQSVRVGFSYVPNRNDIRYYRKKITYRAGSYWDQAYCTIDGQDLNAFGLTFGATFPVFQLNNGLTVGVDVGQRGALSGKMVRERYINFTVGLNVHDIWFIKQRYE